MPLRQVWQKVPEQIRYTARPETRELQNTQSAWTSEQWNLKNWQNLPKKKRSIFASSEWMIRLSEVLWTYWKMRESVRSVQRKTPLFWKDQKRFQKIL